MKEILVVSLLLDIVSQFKYDLLCVKKKKKLKKYMSMSIYKKKFHPRITLPPQKKPVK